MPFDPDSGLIYSEKIIESRRASRSEYDPFTNCLGSKPEYKPPLDGVESLKSVAVRKILCNLDQLTLEALEALPDVVLENLWRQVSRSHLDSVRTWQLFASSRIGQRLVKRCQIGNQALKVLPFEKILQLSNSPSHVWVTNLSLAYMSLSPTYLTKISTLENLRILSLSRNDDAPHASHFDDRVLRTWADAASEQGAFTRLSVLMLYGWKYVTRLSVDRLEAFPALKEVCLYDCGVKRSDILCRDLPWRLNDMSGFFNFAHVQNHQLQWEEIAELYMHARMTESNEDVDMKPRLTVMAGKHGTRPCHKVNPAQLLCLKRIKILGRKGSNKGSASTLAADKPPVKRRKIGRGEFFHWDEVLPGT